MRSRVSVFLLVLCVVGGFFVSSSRGDSLEVILPQPYETNVVLSLEAWVDLHPTNVVVFDYASGDDAFAEWEEYRDTCSVLVFLILESAYNIGQESYAMDQAFNGLISDLEDLPWPDEVPDSLWERWESLIDDWRDQFNASRSSVVGDILAIYSYCEEVTNELAFVDSLFEVREVVDSVAFGASDFTGSIDGGSCTCPDYTVYLQGLSDDVADLASFVEDFWQEWREFLRGWRSVISSGYTSGSIAASTLVKFWDWPFSVSVTNLEEWIDAINSNDVSIRVYNDEFNPLWVDFTNSISVSIDDISADLVLNANVAVTNFFDMFDVLTNALQVVNQNENQTELDFASDQLRGLDDMEEDDTEIAVESYTPVEQIGSTVKGVYDEYKKMFQSIPSEMPHDIVIHQGWNMGGITVQSLHWQPGSNSGVGRCFNFIRNLIRSLWLLLTVLVMFHCVAIDVYVAGLLAVVVYGALFSKPEVIARGFQFFWRILSGILGRNKE